MAKAGRPPIERDGELAELRPKITFTKTEKQLIRMAAKKRNKSFSDYCRELAVIQALKDMEFWSIQQAQDFFENRPQQDRAKAIAITY